jgi:7 transmembrane receptor (rhodopsin family).
MKFSQNPLIACIVSVCYVLNFGPVLLTLCDTDKPRAEHRNNEKRGFEEHDRKNGVSDQLGTNQVSADALEFNTPRNNGEQNAEGYGNKFIYNNVTPNFSIRENKSKSENNASDVDYDYDYEESHNIFNWSELIPTLVVYGATMVIGIAGNSLIIFTICRYRRMKSTTNVFLASLASADLLLIIICIPVKVR